VTNNRVNQALFRNVNTNFIFENTNYLKDPAEIDLPLFAVFFNYVVQTHAHGVHIYEYYWFMRRFNVKCVFLYCK
jgi:hypothetical protein